jgi:hypothetical protein
MAKHTLDLHDILNKGTEIGRTLDEATGYCADRRIPLLEIIPGKGSGQLRKKVLRYLQQPRIKKLYHRVDKDRDNFGRPSCGSSTDDRTCSSPVMGRNHCCIRNRSHQPTSSPSHSRTLSAFRTTKLSTPAALLISAERFAAAMASLFMPLAA